MINCATSFSRSLFGVFKLTPDLCHPPRARFGSLPLAPRLSPPLVGPILEMSSSSINRWSSSSPASGNRYRWPPRRTLNSLELPHRSEGQLVEGPAATIIRRDLETLFMPTTAGWLPPDASRRDARIRFHQLAGTGCTGSSLTSWSKLRRTARLESATQSDPIRSDPVRRDPIGPV